MNNCFLISEVLCPHKNVSDMSLVFILNLSLLVFIFMNFKGSYEKIGDYKYQWT